MAQTADFTFSEACFGDTTMLINTSISTDSIVSVKWDLNGNLNFNDAAGDTVYHLFNSPGTHTVGMRIITDSGFQKAIYKQIPIGYSPVANFTYSNTCFGEETVFSNLSTLQDGEIEDYIWNFGDGSPESYLQDPMHFFNSIDVYNVSLVAISPLGCRDSVSSMVSISDKPNLILDFSGDTTFYEGDSLIIRVIGTYDSIEWSTGAYGNTIIITQSGLYTVNAYLDGCSATQTIPVTVKELPGTGVMNVITPNGDGYNDTWKIFLLERIGPCTANIFNKWGNEVFSSLDYANDWQGTYNGQVLQEGTYYYVVKCNNEQIFKGPINIIR
ncbi:MAG: gliding motility-associated C-terminal domain-containing protein [Bacteroidota bacterium]|nr:gliding motility-associated C-terminal domain-containing protein [Bacteroidota bacterium]